MEAILEYSIEQETPMIHFQYNEAGACLRASELKPKLDRFIRNKYRDGVPSGWYIDKTDGARANDALDYKVKIVVSGQPDIRGGKKINSMYFGNSGTGNSADNKSIFYHKPIQLSIICFIPELREAIDDCIDEFFLSTNFGTRQSKGFGGFSVRNRQSNPIEVLEKKGYHFFYCATNASKEDKMKIAQSIYAAMKGGINRSKQSDDKYDSNRYIKGYIQRQYLDDIHKKNVGSDKAYMKSQIITSNSVRKNETWPQYDEWEFVRALLGVPGSIEFRDELRKGTIEIKGKSKEQEDPVERFKSPILIKIVKKYVIFIVTDAYKDILGKEFEFEIKKEKKENISCNIKVPETSENSGNIKVPTDFNPNEFISGFIKYFDKEKKKLGNVGFGISTDITLIQGGNACNT